MPHEKPTILERICEAKSKRLEYSKSRISLHELKSKIADARPTLPVIEKFPIDRFSIIAEVKKASPSKGIICENFQPLATAQLYAENGASMISVLTEEDFFLGSLDILKEIRAKIENTPLLRKDFIFDSYQLFEAREAGADAILLIAAMLEKKQLEDLANEARELGLTVLGEAHNEEELEKILSAEIELVGINARNLKTFETDLQRVAALISMIPSTKVPIAESAINSPSDIKLLGSHGARGFLIGEKLMRSTNPGKTLKEFLELNDGR